VEEQQERITEIQGGRNTEKQKKKDERTARLHSAYK
jgi:hypothetical protein